MENQNAVVVQQSMPPITLQEVAAQVVQVEQCIKQLMKPEMHYGRIPGCGENPTLLKPGAEMLCKLFQLRPEYHREMRDLGNGHREIVVSCALISRVTGVAAGEGAGTCSTMESKYRWRKSQRSCPKCGVEGAVTRSKFPPKNDPNAQPGWYCYDKKGGCGAQFSYEDPEIRNQQAGRTENPDIADQYNTVQKMADKRAYVAATITAVGASDFVTQDIEDFVDNSREISAPVPTTATVVASEPTKAPVLAPTQPVAAPAAPAPTKPASEPVKPPKSAHGAQFVEGRVVAVTQSSRPAKNGKHWWTIEMTDANGINCKASTWSDTDQQAAQQWQNAGSVCRMLYSVTNGYKNCEGFSQIPEDQRQDDGAPLPEPSGSVINADLPF